MKALRVLNETPTEFGYVIREEVWGSPRMEVVPIADGEDSLGSFAEELQSMLDNAPDEITVTTCYTDSGDWIGSVELAENLCNRRGIRPEHIEPKEKCELVPCQIGFSERDQKWYGWSHRALYGFGVGSEIALGDMGYVADNEANFRRSTNMFWQDDTHNDTVSETVESKDGKKFVRTTWKYTDDIPNEKLRGELQTVFTPYPKTFGHGEWRAETLEDARQMAVDFAEDVA